MIQFATISQSPSRTFYERLRRCDPFGLEQP